MSLSLPDKNSTDQFQDGHLHHTLIEVSWFILHYLDSYNLVGFHILAFDHLTKGPLPQDVENQIS